MRIMNTARTRRVREKGLTRRARGMGAASLGSGPPPIKEEKEIPTDIEKKKDTVKSKPKKKSKKKKR